MATIFCNYCNYSCNLNRKAQYYKHLRTSHSNEPNFQIYCNHGNCNRVFTKVKSLQKHWQRAHVGDDRGDEYLDIGFGPAGLEDNEPNEDEEYNEGAAKGALQYHTAKFLLSAKEEGKLSQTALDSVKDSTQDLVSEYLDNVKKALASKLSASYPGFTYTEDMESIFNSEDMFRGVDSEAQQRSYYLNNFNLVVSIYLIHIKWILRLGYFRGKIDDV